MRASVSPRQSPSSLILASISWEGDSLRFCSFALLAFFLVVVAFFMVVVVHRPVDELKAPGPTREHTAADSLLYVLGCALVRRELSRVVISGAVLSRGQARCPELAYTRRSHRWDAQERRPRSDEVVRSPTPRQGAPTT